jgi:XTP/dITP diphosphohydrolase
VKLRCATTNPGKLREFRRATADFGFADVEIEALDGLKSIEPPVEDGATFEENAVLKAVYYSRYCEEPLFADDSGLEVDALGGEPGVYSARYAGEGAGDAANNRLLREKLHGVENRTARFVCVIALARGGELIGTWRGAVEGRIIDEERGSNGFGYDPMFFHKPFGCTFGEADVERKMHVSHRGQALKAMLAACAGPATGGSPQSS